MNVQDNVQLFENDNDAIIDTDGAQNRRQNGHHNEAQDGASETDRRC